MKLIKSDRIIAIFLFAFSVFIFIQSSQLSSINGEVTAASVSFSPQVWSVILAGLSIILFVKDKKKLKFSKEKLIASFKERKLVYFMLIIALLYVFLLGILGYMISTFLFLTITILVLGRTRNVGKISVLLTSIIVTVVTFYIFTNLMNVYLPSGLFL